MQDTDNGDEEFHQIEPSQSEKSEQEMAAQQYAIEREKEVREGIRLTLEKGVPSFGSGDVGTVREIIEFMAMEKMPYKDRMKVLTIYKGLLQMQGSGGIDMIMGTSSNLAYQIDIQIKTYKDLLVLENEPESLTAQTEEKSEQAKDWERIANLFENARLQNNRVLGYLATEESVKHFLKFDKKTNQEKIDYLDSFIAPVKDFAENPNRHDKKLGVHGIALESIQAASFLNFLQKQRKEYENSEPEKDERTKKSMQDSLKVKDREDKERTAARLVMLLKYLIVKSEITDSNPTSIGEFISFLTGKSADNLRKLYKNPLNKEKAGNYNADLDFVIKKLQLLGIAETRDGLSKFFSENEN